MIDSPTPSTSSAPISAEPTASDPVPLEPLHGIPDVIETPRGLSRALAGLAAGVGPIGIDAERASGFRYGQRAYLIQLYRVEGGTWLIDPTALPDLSRLADFLRPHVWILHAANQDLPCLAEVGLVPERLFDTELAGRLLGRERVSLGHLVASELDAYLEKGHGAADWSTRPLPDSWRRYAALDVEVLPALQAKLAEDLLQAGKMAWAEQEFAALVDAPPPPTRLEPWRRTSGLHSVRTRRGLAYVRSLWQARDYLGAQRDLSPGRLLPDSRVISLALDPPESLAVLTGRKEVSRGNPARHRRDWWAAIESATNETDSQLPALKATAQGPPPARNWASQDAPAALRLRQARAELTLIGDRVNVPLENLITPETLRRFLWTPPQQPTPESVEVVLVELGVRPWQRELVAQALCDVLTTAAIEAENLEEPQ